MHGLQRTAVVDPTSEPSELHTGSNQSHTGVGGGAMIAGDIMTRCLLKKKRPGGNHPDRPTTTTKKPAQHNNQFYFYLVLFVGQLEIISARGGLLPAAEHTAILPASLRHTGEGSIAWRHTHLDQRAVLHAELESLAKSVRSEGQLGMGAGDVLLQRGETGATAFFQGKESFHDHLTDGTRDNKRGYRCTCQGVSVPGCRCVKRRLEREPAAVGVRWCGWAYGKRDAKTRVAKGRKKKTRRKTQTNTHHSFAGGSTGYTTAFDRSADGEDSTYLGGLRAPAQSWLPFAEQSSVLPVLGSRTLYQKLPPIFWFDTAVGCTW